MWAGPSASFRRLKFRFGGKSLFDAARALSVVEFIKQVDLVNFGALASKIVGIQSVGVVYSLKSCFGGKSTFNNIFGSAMAIFHI